MTAATLPTESAPRASFPVRTPSFDFNGEIPRHWMNGNAIGTHVFNGLNLVFPEGERFFIEAVRDCAKDADLSPALRREIRAFNGQEGRHAHEHERYFEILEKQGYEIQPFLQRFTKFIAWSNRFMPASLRLAITAGAEHYTATFGAMALQDPFLDAAHPTMRKLILWHATEEVEHKHVAFDVLQATHPSLWLRRLGFVLATVDLFGFSIAAMRMLLKQDKAAGRSTDEDMARSRNEMKERQERMAPEMKRRIRAYWRRDFHPNDEDDHALAYAKLEEIGIPAA